jgi:hypothetical protein
LERRIDIEVWHGSAVQGRGVRTLFREVTPADFFGKGVYNRASRHM